MTLADFVTKTIRSVLLPLAISAALASTGLAQVSPGHGAIAGTVRDPVGDVAAKIVVQAKSSDGKTVIRATSESTGKYNLADLPAGSYDISATMAGLRAFDRKNVRVDSSSTAIVDIRFEEGSQLSTLGEDAAGAAADRTRHAPPSGPAPRTADGKPDFSGVWWAPVTSDPGRPEWLPDAQRIAAERQANNRKDSPQVRCLPSAVLRRGPLVEFVQSKARDDRNYR